MNKKLDTLASLVLILFGLVFCYASINVGLGKIHAPGSGLIPFGTGALLILFALGTILERQLTVEASVVETKEPLFSGKRWGVVLSVLVSLFVYALVLNILGFILTTFVILAFLFKVSENSSWKTALSTSALTTASTYFLFNHLLQCNFPEGFLGF
jgi:putative tricarboxylic transport membrane protein